MRRLKFERLRRDLSQAALAFISKVPQPAICLIERGRYNPTQDELVALARALGIETPSSLVDDVCLPGDRVDNNSDGVRA